MVYVTRDHRCKEHLVMGTFTHTHDQHITAFILDLLTCR